MKKIIILLLIPLFGCQSEPEIACDCNGETQLTVDKHIGTVYKQHTNSDYFLINIKSPDGDIRGVRPCIIEDSVDYYIGAKFIISGNVKNICYPGPQPAPNIYVFGYYPIDITYLEPIDNTEE